MLEIPVSSPGEAFAFDVACLIASDKYRHDLSELELLGVKGLDAVMHDIRCSLRRIWMRG